MVMTAGSKTVKMTEQASTAGKLLRGVSGALTAGLVVLAITLVIAQVIAGRAGHPGPGILMIVVHLSAAIVAVLLQRASDHSRRGIRWQGPLLILLLGALLFWFAWWQ
jgi:hypothetical protein